ncbi:MAG: ABC transporter permease [Lachnospiraceae bacterium]|nr:ABC transporter permease [Lachnospiraceae bacterium]
MNKLFTVIDFELKSYTKNKSFVITTLVMVVLLFAASFLPKVFDMSSITGVETKSIFSGSDDKDEDKDSEKEDGFYLYYSENDVLGSKENVNEIFAEVGILKKAKSKEDIIKKVKSQKAKGGFYIKDDMHYEYYVFNAEMYDDTQMIFETILTNLHKQNYLLAHGMDISEFVTEYEAIPEGNVNILGKDASENFWYCYGLVILIFMLIIMYGVMIATSVTNEKSNRSIEVLVTSIDAKYLLFGKVIAGTFAVVIQAGSILAATLIGYGINHDAWNGKLDMILDIPSDVIISFAVFGVGGFLFYAFVYGAVGALVSKTEDINKVAGTVQMVIMIVYFVVLFSLSKPDGMIMKVCSILPVSSYSAMFVRIAMGKVTVPEIIISAVLLYASIIFIGWLAAKIYRMGTLRYGNPIKFRNALKYIKEKE